MRDSITAQDNSLSSPLGTKHEPNRLVKIPPQAQAAPPAIREYHDRCGNDEELITWWERDRPSDPHEALWVITCSRASGIFSVVSFPPVVSHWSHQLYGSSYDARGMEQQLLAGLWQAPEASRLAVEAFLLAGPAL